ncbi:MAG TPA: hypothetical protein VHZ33_32660, partial [Trebonia sp.]|nr:hypothetical protein [Trebonia sp.]
MLIVHGGGEQRAEREDGTEPVEPCDARREPFDRPQTPPLSRLAFRSTARPTGAGAADGRRGEDPRPGSVEH